jgi:short subunit dehydrogenase-like uncharacterized protein
MRKGPRTPTPKPTTTATRLATLCPGLDVTAGIATEIACRILGGHTLVRAGAWTPGVLFGPGLVSAACDITVIPADPVTALADAP